MLELGKSKFVNWAMFQTELTDAPLIVYVTEFPLMLAAALLQMNATTAEP
jgi:hypothetical protein